MEKLPTKSEMIAKWKKAIGEINADVVPGQRMRVVSMDKGCIAVTRNDGGWVASTTEFRPDIKPVKKYRAVLVRDSFGEMLMRISDGKIENGGLKCFYQCEMNRFLYWKHWCSCEDVEHHSAGWKMEWLEGVHL